jgi:DNA-binding PadR family transcriptional regulator
VKPTYPRRMVDRLILEELRRGPAHGYAISTAFARRGLRVARSSVHTALRRLERDGVVTGRWQDGWRRRVYRLTRAGDEALRLRGLEVRSLARR